MTAAAVFATAATVADAAEAVLPPATPPRCPLYHLSTVLRWRARWMVTQPNALPAPLFFPSSTRQDCPWLALAWVPPPAATPIPPGCRRRHHA